MSTRGFARGRTAALWLGSVSVAAVLTAFSGSPASATCFSWNATFNGVSQPFNWCTDRADTASEDTGAYYGRTDVLHLGIADETNSPWDPAGFYETEGYKTQTGLTATQSYVSGDLYIPASWKGETSAFESVGLWATLGDGSSATSYPIVNFYNGEDGGGEIRYWDFDHYVVVNVAINYDGWNTFRVDYIPGPTTGTGTFDIVVNGKVVATMTGGDFANSPVDPTTNSQYEVILDSHTNGLSAYDVYWSDMIFSSLVNYNADYTVASLAPSAIRAGDELIGTYVDRRGLDWENQKAAWAHVVGASGTIDGGNGAIDDHLVGAQLGMDVFKFGDDATRAGFTFGYSSQSTSVGFPGGGSAGTAAGSSTAIGAYITHESPSFYADLLGQYRFINYDVTAGSASGTVGGGSVDVAAESGFHIPVANGLTITPFGQLVYEHLSLNNASLADSLIGSVDTSFGSSDALIARARVLAQFGTGGLNLFASAGASTDLLGGKEATSEGITYTSSLGGAQAEFTGGVEGKLAAGLSLFGSGEYDVSFSGDSQNYTGRVGLRNDF
jgi:hypothetical protein